MPLKIRFRRKTKSSKQQKQKKLLTDSPKSTVNPAGCDSSVTGFTEDDNDFASTYSCGVHYNGCDNDDIDDYLPAPVELDDNYELVYGDELDYYYDDLFSSSPFDEDDVYDNHGPFGGLISPLLKTTPSRSKMKRIYGDYKTFSQCEFLLDCTGRQVSVIVHFFHKKYMEECEQVDCFLEELAKKHEEVRFIRVDAKLAPFFVSRLRVKAFPTILAFCDSQVMGMLTSDDESWSLHAIENWLQEIECI